MEKIERRMWELDQEMKAYWDQQMDLVSKGLPSDTYQQNLDKIALYNQRLIALFEEVE